MAPLNWNPLVRRAHTDSVSWVILTSVYTFLAGVGFTVLVGPFPMPRILAIYATACAVLCTLLFGYVLVKALQWSPSGTRRS
jgi:hypothetical protein